MCFSSFKNHKLKVKLWWIGDCKRKKTVIFLLFNCLFCPKEIFFNIQVLSQCIVYWIRFQNIHACTYLKTLLHAFFCLFLKSSNTFSVSLSLFLLYFIKLFLKRFEKNCLTLARLQELMFFWVMSVPIHYN